MANVELVLDTAIHASDVLAAAVDFSDRRPTLWPTIEPSAYRVHAVGDTWAEVTEGSRFLGLIWARERYRWDAPGIVRATVVDSNVFQPGSTWELEARETGEATRVAVRSHRRARGLRGRILGAMLTLAGRPILAGNLRRTIELVGGTERTAEATR